MNHRRSRPFPPLAPLVIGLLLLSICANAASRPAPGRSEEQYTRSVWRVQDGLPEDIVQALAETPDGYLWIGTTGGLVRFDGTRFVLLQSPALPSSMVNSIFCLTPSADGSLWVGTEGGGLLHLGKGAPTTYGPAQGLTDGFVRSVLEDRHGGVWVGTDHGLFRIDGNRANRVEMPPGVDPLAVHAITEGRDGRIWVGGSHLLSIDDGRIGTYRLPGTYSSNRVKSILQSADGTLWVGTVGGLDRMAHGAFERVPEIHDTVRTLRQTGDGSLWIGTISSGLWIYRDGIFSHREALLPGNTVLSVLEDTSHQVWVGLQEGLVRLGKTPVHLVTLPGGSDADFETVSGDTGGSLWAVASQAYRIRNGVATTFRIPQLPNVRVRNLLRDREGALWVGTDGSGAYRIDAGRTTHLSAPRDLTNNFVRAFLESRRGDMWIATDEGVSRMRAGESRRLTMADGLAYNSTRCLLEDTAGDIWIGTDQGLSRWHGNSFVQDAVTEALRHEKVWSILEDTTGALWFGTRDHGLFRSQDGAIVRFTTDQGLASNSIYQLLEDGRRALWISGPNTISSIDERALHSTADPATQHLAVSVYTMPYGAADAQMYGGRQPSGYVDPGGGLWFPSSRGIAHVLPSRGTSTPPPRLVIDTVTLDGRTLPLGRTIELPAHVTRLEISYLPLSLAPQAGIHYRYKLEGFDHDWVEAGTHLTAAYTNVPAGAYTFRVQTANTAGTPIEASLAIRRDPFFWQRPWFVVLSLTSLLLLGWGTFRLRVHQVQLRFRAVLEERSRLARAMHDTVIQGCTSVSALLEAVASLQSENQVLREDLLQHARAQVSTTIDEAREAVWNLRHDDGVAITLGSSIEVLATQLGKEFGRPIPVVSFGTPFSLPHSVAREILLVLREATYNAALHGHASEICIELRYTQDALLLTVRDAGIGFDVQQPAAEGHYGITGMRERMQRIGGAFDLHSTRGTGTAVHLAVERSAAGAFPARGRSRGPG